MKKGILARLIQLSIVGFFVFQLVAISTEDSIWTIVAFSSLIFGIGLIIYSAKTNNLPSEVVVRADFIHKNVIPFITTASYLGIIMLFLLGVSIGLEDKNWDSFFTISITCLFFLLILRIMQRYHK